MCRVIIATTDFNYQGKQGWTVRSCDTGRKSKPEQQSFIVKDKDCYTSRVLTAELTLFQQYYN